MKLGIRAGSTIVVVIIVLAAAVLLYQASDRMGMAGKAASESRESTFVTYRSAQMLKALIHGYELTINEYYSTALKPSAYQKKAAEFKAAIEKEVAVLQKLNSGDSGVVAELKNTLGEIESLRGELEGALSESNRDWELAREALYKLTVVSVRATQPVELISRLAEERSVEMDTAWSEHRNKALREMQIAMLLALAASILVLVGIDLPPAGVPTWSSEIRLQG